MEQICFALVTLCGISEQILVTVSVQFARKAYSVYLFFCNMTHQAVPRNDTLGDACDCHALGRET